MSNWILVAKLTECPVGKTLEVVAGDLVLALANYAGKIYALDGICAHQGGPLGRGTVGEFVTGTGCQLTCPWHGWQYDLETGRMLTSETIFQASYPTRVEGDSVFVDICPED